MGAWYRVGIYSRVRKSWNTFQGESRVRKVSISYGSAAAHRGAESKGAKRAFVGRGGVQSRMLGTKYGEDKVLMVEQGQKPGTGLLEPKQGEKDIPVEEQPHV